MLYMKQTVAIILSALLAFTLFSCAGVNTPEDTKIPVTVTDSPATVPVSEAPSSEPLDTEDHATQTEAVTEARVTETGVYKVISTDLSSSEGSYGSLTLYSDNTYKAEFRLSSAEYGVRSETALTEYGIYTPSDGDELTCTPKRLSVKISYENESDKKIASETLGVLCGMGALTEAYVASYEKACGEGIDATVEEAGEDEFLSGMISGGDKTEVLLDRDEKLAYDVTVRYDLPEGKYRIAEEGCTLTLDADGKAGECTLEFELSGDDGDGLGRYSNLTLLKGTYERNGGNVKCIIKGELTLLKYDSEESQKEYLRNIEEEYANGDMLEEVYVYNKEIASDEGRFLDYGDTPDEYGLFVIDITHAAVFTYTPSEEYAE